MRIMLRFPGAAYGISFLLLFSAFLVFLLYLPPFQFFVLGACLCLSFIYSLPNVKAARPSSLFTATCSTHRFARLRSGHICALGSSGGSVARYGRYTALLTSSRFLVQSISAHQGHEIGCLASGPVFVQAFLSLFLL